MKHYPAASGLRGSRKPSPAPQPDRPGRLLHQARAMVVERRPEEALDTCDRALPLMPRTVELLCVRAAALLDLGFPELALAHLDAAIDMDPNNGDLVVERCRAYIELGNLKEAHEDLDTLSQSFHDDPEILYLRAIVEELGGNGRDADLLYDLAVQADPDRYVKPLRVPSDWLEEQVLKMISDIDEEKREQLGSIEAKVMPVPPAQLWARSFEGIPPTVLGVLTGIVPTAEDAVDVPANTSVQIFIFQRNLERMVRSREALLEQLHTTVQQEIEHFLKADNPEPQP